MSRPYLESQSASLAPPKSIEFNPQWCEITKYFNVVTSVLALSSSQKFVYHIMYSTLCRPSIHFTIYSALVHRLH